MLEVREYVLAVADHFFFWFGGIGLVLIEILKKWRRTKHWAERLRWEFWVLGGLCIFIATFQAWHEQREQTVALQKKLDAQTEPQLSLGIDQIGVGREKNSSVIYVSANLTNLGAPSIADDWTLEVTKVGETIPKTFITFYLNPGSFVIMKDMKISSADALYSKAIQRPLEHNGRIRGILIFLPDISTNDLMTKGTKFVLHCRDVKNKDVSSGLMWDPDSKQQMYAYPGLEPVPANKRP